jgi:hypothetical protein
MRALNLRRAPVDTSSAEARAAASLDRKGDQGMIVGSGLVMLIVSAVLLVWAFPRHPRA